MECEVRGMECGLKVTTLYLPVAPTSGPSPFLTKGTAICLGHPGLLAIYSVENSTVYLNHSSLSGCSVDLPPGKYSIAVLPDVNGTLGITSVLGTWVEITGKCSSTMTM